MRRIMVSGSRNLTNWSALADTVMEHVNALDPEGKDTFTIVHGSARGADQVAVYLAKHYPEKFIEEPHPADWDKYGKSAGYIRNSEMVKSGVEVLIAFPQGESRGTRMAVNVAEKKGVPVAVHEQ